MACEHVHKLYYVHIYIYIYVCIYIYIYVCVCVCVYVDVYSIQYVYNYTKNVNVNMYIYIYIVHFICDVSIVYVHTHTSITYELQLGTSICYALHNIIWSPFIIHTYLLAWGPPKPKIMIKSMSRLHVFELSFLRLGQLLTNECTSTWSMMCVLSNLGSVVYHGQMWTVYPLVI